MRGSLIAGALILAVTELLGAVHLLAPAPLVLAWLFVGAALVVRWRVRPDGLRLREEELSTSPFGGGPAAWAVIALFLGLTFVTGIFGAPNVWDGLTYHLPRVERWVEHGHLGFWPTSVDRQLWMAPWNGYAILQFRLLTGGDRLAFLPSWLAYLGCILVTARVVRQLGGNERQAAFGALVFATMPVAVLHASSVQTDLAAAFWVLCVAALSLEAWQDREVAGHWRHASWLGLAVALAVATKGTVLLAVLPWLVLYGLSVVRHAGLQRIGRPLLIGTLVLLLLNGPHFARNVALFADPLGDATTRGFLRLAPWTISGGVANLMANLSLHLGAPWSAWNEWWTEALILIQRSVLKTDPAVLFPYFGGFRVQSYSSHESLAGSPVHLLLGVVLILALVVRWRAVRGSALVPWVVAGLAAVLLHMTMVRWQPYGARLQLASLVWLIPMVASLVRGRLSRVTLTTLVVLIGIPAVTTNRLRPLGGERSVFSVSREDQYFSERPSLQPLLATITEMLVRSGCVDYRLVAGFDTPEYLLLAKSRAATSHKLPQHLFPRSRSGTLKVEQGSEGKWCGVVIIDRDDLVEVMGRVGGRLAWEDGGAAVLLQSR